MKTLQTHTVATQSIVAQSHSLGSTMQHTLECLFLSDHGGSFLPLAISCQSPHCAAVMD